MIKISMKKLITAMALCLSITTIAPSILPLTNGNNVITVEAAAAKLNKKSATLLAGQTLKLKVSNKGKKTIKWSSNNEKVATVKNGTVTAIGKGKATIIANIAGKKLKCKLTVKSNNFSFNPIMISNSLDSGVYFIPTNVYYKNGKLYCKANVFNKAGYTISFLGDKEGNIQKKLNVTLKGYSFDSLKNSSEAPVVIAKGNVKVSLPKNIKHQKSKAFTVELSGSQIKKKGVDLSTFYFIDMELNSSLYTF